MKSSNLETANKMKLIVKEKMRQEILNELQEVPYATGYELSLKLPNSNSGITRYLESMVGSGELRFIQKIQDNHLVKLYYIPKFDENSSKFYFPSMFIDLLQWKRGQTIFLHMITAKFFQFTAIKDTELFAFATLSYKLKKENDRYYVQLPENFRFFYQIHDMNDKYFSLDEANTTLTYSIPHDENISVLPNPPKKEIIQIDPDLNNWRRNLIQISKNVKMIHESLPTHLMCCTIPILVKIDQEPKNFKIIGTGFLYKEKDGQFIVTAYHNLFDDNDEPFEYFLGFQTRDLKKIVLVDGKKIQDLDENAWFVDKANDLAILPINIPEDVKNDMVHEFITRSDLTYKTRFSRQAFGIHLGFGYGKTSWISVKANSDEKKYPVWMPLLASKVKLELMKNKIIHVHSLALNGFSGGPLFFLSNNKYYLLGIMKRGGYYIDRKAKQKVSTEKGTAVHFNEVINLLNREYIKSVESDIKFTIVRMKMDFWTKSKRKIAFVDGTDDEFIVRKTQNEPSEPLIKLVK